MSVRWQRRPDVLWRGLLDGVAVLPRDAPEPLVLGGLAAALWLALERPARVDELVEELASALGEAPTGARSKVTATLRDLAYRHLVERL